MNARATTPFPLGLGSLAAFLAERGHARVPRRHQTSDGFRLGAWVLAQRERSRAGRISFEERVDLNTLAFSWDGRRARLEAAIAGAEQWSTQTGHSLALLPAQAEHTGVPIRTSLHRAGRAGRLTTAERHQLTLLGFVWDGQEARWERGFLHLDDWLRSYGRPPRERERSADNYPVGTWLSWQRRLAARDLISLVRLRRMEERLAQSANSR